MADGRAHPHTALRMEGTSLYVSRCPRVPPTAYQSASPRRSWVSNRHSGTCAHETRLPRSHSGGRLCAGCAADTQRQWHVGASFVRDQNIGQREGYPSSTGRSTVARLQPVRATPRCKRVRPNMRLKLAAPVLKRAGGTTWNPCRRIPFVNLTARRRSLSAIR